MDDATTEDDAIVLLASDSAVHTTRAIACHIDLLPDAIILASLTAFSFGEPACDAEGVQACAERPSMSGYHKIDLILAFELQVESGDPFADHGLGLEDVER